MRTLFKHFVIDSFSIYLVSLATSGMVFASGIYTILFAGAALMLVSMVIKPVINILLLPLNLVTFGLFRWVGFVIAIYLVTLIVPGFKIMDFAFSGYNSYWFYISPVYLTGFLAFVAFSFLITLISSIIDWIFK